MLRTDAEIRQAVLRELKSDVGVVVESGMVTLTGTVDGWDKRLAALEAAHRVIGVLEVVNDLQVQVPGMAERTDTEIARAVRHALEWDTLAPESRIRWTVGSGQVTLEGEVACRSQRDDAERAVRNLLGVRHVASSITIKPPKLLPADIRKAIREALERHADREAERIDLSVKDGRVSLSGIVHSWTERDAVVGAARGTPGVRTIEDHLQIRPLAV